MNSNRWEGYKEIMILDESGKTLLVQDINTREYYIKKYVFPEQVQVYNTLSKVQSMNLAKVYEVSETSDLYGTDYAMVLEEYIEGRTLESILNEKESISPKGVIDNIIQICNGLKCVHHSGIVHRDIKPSNIVITKNGIVKIIDFGIARIIKEDKNKDTTLLGTEGYASPEQFGFSQTRATADIYSLGIMMNVMLTGHSVDEGFCREPLRKVVSKCTDLNPRYRYENVDKLKAELIKIRRIYYGSKFSKMLCILLLILVICTVVLGSINLYKVQLDKRALQNNKVITELKSTMEPKEKDSDADIQKSSEAPIDLNKEDNTSQESKEVTPESPDFLYLVNQSEEDVLETYFTNGKGKLLFDSLEPIGESHNLGFSGTSYITYCVPCSSINFWIENNGNTTIRNPAVQFEFTNVMLWGEYKLENWSYYDHVHGLGGYNSIKWEPGENFVLRPGEKSEMQTLYLSESPVFMDNGEISVTINILADDCKSKSFTVPIALNSY